MSLINTKNQVFLLKLKFYYRKQKTTICDNYFERSLI